jgi:signal transduction histidine kinase
MAVMSHELRTPLNAIAGYANLLDEGVQGPLNDKQREYIRRVLSNEAHLLGLINDVLNFAKLEAGRVHFDVTDVSLRTVLTEVDDLIAPQVVAKGVRYENRGCGADVAVRADREKLRQVILNLLSNAVKFTPAGGEIVIECGIVGVCATIAVRDTGIGIAADKLEAVFEPFVQLGKTPNREGTGLGLAISRDLARAMGGELTATSVPGQGSTFTLSLPLATGGAGGGEQSCTG